MILINVGKNACRQTAIILFLHVNIQKLYDCRGDTLKNGDDNLLFTTLILFYYKYSPKVFIHNDIPVTYC